MQVAQDDAFTEILADQSVMAEADVDHTVRVLVTDLQPNRHYYYRFIAPDNSISRTGRTCTAPSPESRHTLKIAVFSCQDYEQGYFTAYRRFIDEDTKAPPNEKVNFILHVGDFIYETVRGPGTVGDTDLNGNPISLVNADGSPRRIGRLPSGGRRTQRGWYVPDSLEDYRVLYRTYLADPDLQEARALYPFVQIWDDHELFNDYWQSYVKGRSIARLKVASNQAWFEFVPAALSMGGRDIDNHQASDFATVQVDDTPPGDFDADYLSLEPNNLAAIGSMTIYRTVRWGRMAELFLIDGRSYRGPRGLPQSFLTIGRHPYPEAPIDPALIDLMNEGRMANNGSPPEQVEYLGKLIPNPRKNAPRGSMLGRRQKQWLQQGLVASDATWKILGLNVGLMRHGFDDSFRPEGGVNHLLWTDGWDGYPAERRELTKFFHSSNLKNLVSLTGDRHAHLAGEVYDDFDSAAPSTVLTEFAGAAVSSPNRLVIQKHLLAHDPELAKRVSFDGDRFAASQKIMPAMNAWMLHGEKAARSVHDRGVDDQVAKLSNPAVNPHLKYVDADAYGYYTAHFTEVACQVEFVCIAEPIELERRSSPDRRRVIFEVKSQNSNNTTSVSLKSVSGERPLGGLKT